MTDAAKYRPSRCRRCANWWVHTCWPAERFDVIARICPTCIAKFTPVWGAA